MLTKSYYQIVNGLDIATHMVLMPHALKFTLL